MNKEPAAETKKDRAPQAKQRDRQGQAKASVPPRHTARPAAPTTDNMERATPVASVGTGTHEVCECSGAATTAAGAEDEERGRLPAKISKGRTFSNGSGFVRTGDR